MLFDLATYVTLRKQSGTSPCPSFYIHRMKSEEVTALQE